MKIKGLVLALFLMVASAHSAVVEHYFSGAWWCNTAPKPYLKTSGEIRLYLLDDFSMTVEIVHNGAVVFTGSGTWREMDIFGNRLSVSFTVNTPTVHRFSGTLKNGFPFVPDFFGSGTYSSIPRGYAGRWQVTGQ